MINLSVKIPGLKIKNPIMPSSGCFDFGWEWQKHYDLNILGTIILKSVTLKRGKGHKNPVLIKNEFGFLNAIGLKNPGLKKVIASDLKKLAKVYKGKVITSIAGKSFEEYTKIAREISKVENVGAIELNISCPNVKNYSIAFGTDPQQTEKLTKMVKEVSSVPVYVKLSPNVTSIVEIALAAERGGADAISMINTITGMELDNKTGKPILTNKTGGLSGKAIFPIAIRQIYEVSQNVKIPVIGMGGVESASDVIKMMSAGASAVAIGSFNYINQKGCQQIIEDLPRELKKIGVKDINEIVGRAWK